MTFPSFYAECAYRDGRDDAETGKDSTPAYRDRWTGVMNPLAAKWYRKGFTAARKPEVAA